MLKGNGRYRRTALIAQIDKLAFEGRVMPASRGAFGRRYWSVHGVHLSGLGAHLPRRAPNSETARSINVRQ